jgi:hypothetical protein
VIAFERLAMLALGELPEAERTEVEEHVLGCDHCASVLEALLDLGDVLPRVVRSGGGRMLPGRALVERLDSEHLVTRRYRVDAGAEVACTVDARDVYTAIHLGGVDTRDVKRIDWLYDSPSSSYRVEDIPFQPGDREIVFVQPATYVRTLPSERKTIRLVAVDDTGDRLLGEYTLNHTAFRL